MAQQNIDTGSNPNDGTGDPLRTAFIKTEENFTDLYDQLGSSFPFTSSAAQPAQIVGEGGTTTAILGITGSLEATQDITASSMLVGSEIVAENNAGTKIAITSNTLDIYGDSIRCLAVDSSVFPPLVVVNPDQQNVDFRAKGDTSPDLLFVDASADKVGILTSSPSRDLDVNGDIKADSYFGDITDSDPGVNTQFYQTQSQAIIAGASGFSVVCISEG